MSDQWDGETFADDVNTRDVPHEPLDPMKDLVSRVTLDLMLVADTREAERVLVELGDVMECMGPKNVAYFRSWEICESLAAGDHDPVMPWHYMTEK